MKPQLDKILKSEDGITRKFQFLIDKYITEVVLVERPEKNIICFPSQIGCSMTCRFCKSGKFVKDLTPEQIFLMINTIKQYYVKDCYKKTLLSCMGEGEPSLNKNIFEIFEMLNASRDSLALATTGIRPEIFRELNEFSNNLKIMLSLHAPTAYQRSDLLNIKMDPVYLLSKFNEYKGKKEINYVLLQNFNDSVLDCFALKKLCKNIPVKINRYNRTNSSFRMSKNLKKFMFVYKTLLGKIEYYETDGSDISASCGMMSYQIK